MLDLQDHLKQGAEVCDRTLRLYATPDGTPFLSHPDLAWLDPAQRRKLAEDRRDLLTLLAGARVRLGSDEPSDRRAALALLDEAEALGSLGLAPSRALYLERADNLEHLGEHERAAEARRMAEQTPARSSSDHYALAAALALKGTREGLRQALVELDLALALNPRHYWSTVQRGICHLELGEPLLAAADFGQSIGLWPEFAWGYFNRGCVLDRAGRKDEALADYTAALERDPKFIPARVNRGLVELERKRYAAALIDFDAALAARQSSDQPAEPAGHRRDPALLAGRAMALEGLKRHAEADRAFADALSAAPPRGDPVRARLYWSYGFAITDRLPEQARAAFDEVLRADPNHPQALYGRAMLAARAGRDDEALAALDRALLSSPGFNEARRSRAVLRARKGDWELAAADINWCLEREPASADTLYAAACVAALAARPSFGSLTSGNTQALDLLRRALDQGADPARARDDPDLASLKSDPRLHAILTHAKSLDMNHNKE